MAKTNDDLEVVPVVRPTKIVKENDDLEVVPVLRPTKIVKENDDTDDVPLRKPTADDMQALKALIARANVGEQVALDELRDFLDENPQVWKVVGDLGRMAENAWIKLITDQDSLAAASIRRQLAQIKEELVGEAPSVIEKLLGDQVVMTLLEVKHLEMLSAGTAGNISQAALLLRRLESAQRRHNASIRSLVVTRNLLNEAKANPRLRIFNAERKMG